ncbi:MAG TPA: hypothetical protein VME41_11865 [Stellaceae bacterium]|nr:hypothetical protein [Stellaceae bacterium]
MICPGNNNDCDNPGCRHGGCQGRKPELPLFRVATKIAAVSHSSRETLPAAKRGNRELEPIAA